MNDENNFWTRVKSGLNTGLFSSGNILDNARKRSRDLEELGVLKIDIRRLESRNSRLFADLGLKVFSLFSEEGQHSISSKTPAIRDVLEELERNSEMLREKEEKLGESQ